MLTSVLESVDPLLWNALQTVYFEAKSNLIPLSLWLVYNPHTFFPPKNIDLEYLSHWDWKLFQKLLFSVFLESPY